MLLRSIQKCNKVLRTPSHNTQDFHIPCEKELKSKSKLNQTIFMLTGGGALQMLPTHLKSLEIRSVTQLG